MSLTLIRNAALVAGVGFGACAVTQAHKGYMFTRGSALPGERRLQEPQLKGGTHSRSYGFHVQDEGLVTSAPREGATPVNMYHKGDNDWVVLGAGLCSAACLATALAAHTHIDYPLPKQVENFAHCFTYGGVRFGNGCGIVEQMPEGLKQQWFVQLKGTNLARFQGKVSLWREGDAIMPMIWGKSGTHGSFKHAPTGEVFQGLLMLVGGTS